MVEQFAGGDGDGTTWSTAREAAEHLGVSERTIRRAIGRGELRAAKLGGTFRITPEELERYGANRRRGSAGQAARADGGRSAARTGPSTAERGLTLLPGQELREIVMPRVPLAPLVGRAGEHAAILSDLGRKDVRLLTLTGPGGVGKTHLALHAAAGLADAFGGQVCFVDLASIRDPVQVAPAIAHALGIGQPGAEPVERRLGTVLNDRRLLLVLDNFEQVAEAAPTIASLIASCPGIKVLATSRERLRLASEHERVIAPLALPRGGEWVSADGLAELVGCGAVQLFIERAKGAQADFEVTRENAFAVAEICRRLDGLPLAIELIAARIKVLPPTALLARLDRRLPLLTGGPRDLPTRLQTMRNAVAWSHDLLTERERTFFRRLVVFSGGFTLDAAEAVCSWTPASGAAATPGADRACGSQVLATVASLLDKSLLQADGVVAGETRYRMLETIREFGLELLAASNEEAAVRTRHAAWCQLLVAEVLPFPLRGAVRPQALDRLAAELDNLRAALAWCDESGNAEALAALATNLTQFWSLRGLRVEGLRWLERALAMAETDRISSDLHAALFHAAGALGRSLGDYERATAFAQSGLERFRVLDDPWRIASHLHLLGILERGQGDLSRAQELHQEALARFRAIGDPFWVAVLTCDLGMLAYWEGDARRAVSLLGEALERFRALDDLWGIGLALSGLAVVSGARGDVATAARLHLESLPHALRVGSNELLIDVVLRIAVLAASTGKVVPAVRLIGAAEALRQELGYALERPEQDRCDRAADAARAVLGDEAFAAALASGRRLSLETAVAEAQSILSDPAFTNAPPFGLTPREIEILCLLAGGADDRAIADRLFISPATVARHVANLCAKLDADSRARAVALAHRHGLA